MSELKTHAINRRHFLFGLLTFASGSAITTLADFFGNRTIPSPTLTKPAATEIAQPATPSPRAFMDRAMEMRSRAVESGDQAFGAIIVKDNRIVGWGPSRVIVNRDPTAHAEVEAIRDACQRLGTRDLSGCEMYGTSKACAMCETAAYWANIARLYYGDSITNAGAPRYASC